MTVTPPAGADITAARAAISAAKRDFAGFIEGDQPNITEAQFQWLSYRMSYADDSDAFAAMRADDIILPGAHVLLWRQDPSFAAVEQVALGNKREGFRLLTVHLAGKALRQINSMLSSSDPKIVIRALTLWERTMGLLVDKVTVIDKDDLQRLTERLMQPMKVTPIEGPSIVEGEWRESPRLPAPGPSDVEGV